MFGNGFKTSSKDFTFDDEQFNSFAALESTATAAPVSFISLKTK